MTPSWCARTVSASSSVGVFHEAGAAHGRGAPRRLEHVLERKTQGDEPIGPDLHLELAHLAAKDVHLGDAGNAQQPRAQRPIGERAQFHAGAVRRGEADDEKQPGARGQRPHLRRVHALEQFSRDLGQPLPDQLARLENGRVRSKYQNDGREALDALRADGFQSRSAVKGRFQRAGDELLDFFRGEPGRFGLNHDLRRGELGEDIEPGPRGNEQSISQNDARQRRDDASKAE